MYTSLINTIMIVNLSYVPPLSGRPVTTASGCHVRVGTASMLTEPGGPFIDVSKLNMSKYAQRPALAKVRMWFICPIKHMYL